MYPEITKDEKVVLNVEVKESLNVPRTKMIEEAFMPLDPLEHVEAFDLEEDDEYQRECWLFGERNL